MTNPSTIQEVGIILGHMQEQLARLLVIAEKSATKEEVRSADDSLRKDMEDLKRERDEDRKRIRVLEDDRTERRAMIGLLAGAIGLIGIPGLILVAKAFLASGG